MEEKARKAENSSKRCDNRAMQTRGMGKVLPEATERRLKGIHGVGELDKCGSYIRTAY